MDCPTKDGSSHCIDIGIPKDNAGKKDISPSPIVPTNANNPALPPSLIGNPSKVVFQVQLPYRTGVARVKTVECPVGIYYKQVGPRSLPTPVAVGDLVVRLRGPFELENGKRDEYDIFDGPWRVLAFQKSLPMEENVYTGKDMHSLQVKLSFPQGSVTSKNTFVKIGQLLPVVNAIPRGSVLYPNTITVREMETFRAVEAALAGKTFTPSDPAYSIFAGPPLYFSELEGGVYVALTEVDPHKGSDDSEYEVSKLRNKRLLVYNANSEVVEKEGLVTESSDPWIRSLLTEYPGICRNKVVVAQYLTHWAGWANEDDLWQHGAGLPMVFVNEYHQITDPYRGEKVDSGFTLKHLVFEDDLRPKKKRKMT